MKKLLIIPLMFVLSMIYCRDMYVTFDFMMVADEYPMSFTWNGKRYEIEEITDRWYQSNPTVDWLAVNYFKVKTTDGLHCILKHDIEIDRWFLVKTFQIPGNT